MPTPTYDLIASNVLSSNTASVTFSNLPQTGYRDLILVVEGSGNGYPQIRPNSSTSSIYNEVEMKGSSGGATSASQSNQQEFNIGYPDWFATRGMFIWQIFDYATTDKHKSTLARATVAGFTVYAVAGRWASTTAVSSLYVGATTTWNSGTTFHLYGIAS